jgi:hypothetical protein
LKKASWAFTALEDVYFRCIHGVEMTSGWPTEQGPRVMVKKVRIFDSYPQTLAQVLGEHCARFKAVQDQILILEGEKTIFVRAASELWLCGSIQNLDGGAKDGRSRERWAKSRDLSPLQSAPRL